jgi:hypothetical protein
LLERVSQAMRVPVKISRTPKTSGHRSVCLVATLIAPAIKPIDYHLDEEKQAAPAFRPQLHGTLTADPDHGTELTVNIPLPRHAR